MSRFPKLTRAGLIGLPMLALALSAPLSTAHTATTDAAAGVKPGQYVKYRRSVYQVIGWNMGPMAAAVKGQVPYDRARFATQAQRVATLAPMLLEGFHSSSKGAKDTEAKDEIWTDWTEFTRLMRDFEQKSATLARVAQGGDLAAIKPAFVAMGKACGACHEKFKHDHD